MHGLKIMYFFQCQRLLGISRSAAFLSKKFGTRAGKTVTSIVPLIVVWLLTGIWHGTGLNYVLWGCYYGGIIIISSIFQPEFKKLTTLLRINTDTAGLEVFL